MFAIRTDVDVIAVFRQRTRPRGASLAAIVTAAIVALALALTGFAQSAPGRQVGRDLGLFAPSEPYTELYFSDPGAVASATQPVPGRIRRRASVAFVIHDAGHRALTYRWSVHVASRVGGATLRSGMTRLRAGQATTIHRHVRTGCAPAVGHAPAVGSRRRRSPGRVRITVTLSHPRESIGYWVRCHG